MKDNEDFLVNNLEEILKMRKCTMSNEINTGGNIFTCPCLDDNEFRPICEACAMHCHKSHKPVQIIKNSHFICGCGEDSHKVRNFIPNVSNFCIYNDFHRFTRHKGYYLIQEVDKVVCSACLEYCSLKSVTDSDVTAFSLYEKDDLKVCKCDRHEAHSNVFKIHEDLSRKFLELHLLDLNMNLINKCELTNQKCLSVFIKHIDIIYSKGVGNIGNHFELYSNSDSNNKLIYEFFSNTLICKILEIFSNFSDRSLINKNLIDEKYKFTLLQMFKHEEDLVRKNLSSDKVFVYSYSKIYFADFLYKFYIKRTILNNFIKIGADVYSNLNLYQRHLYLHDAKNFHKNYSNTNVNNNDTQIDFNFIDEFSFSLIELFERYFAYDELYRIPNYRKVIFTKINKIIKNLIKYNLISQKIKIKYFDLVQQVLLDKTATSDNRERLKYENCGESSIYIIKSVFYALNYLNDTIILCELKDEIYENTDIAFKEDGAVLLHEKKQFVFNPNNFSNTLSTIFYQYLTDIDRRICEKPDPKYAKKLLKYDLYIKKIFSLMLLAYEKSYVTKSIDNLKYTSKVVLNNFLEPTLINNYQEKTKNLFYQNTTVKEALDEILKTSNNLRNVCYEFQIFDISYDIFLIKSASIFNDLTVFIKGYLTKLLNIQIPYFQIKKNHLGDENDIRKIGYLQLILKHTLFINSLNMFIEIYGQNSVYEKEKHSKFICNIDWLARFLNLMIFDNYENLFLLMSLNVDKFFNTFIQADKSFLCLVNNMFDMIFGSETCPADNLIFFLRLVINFFNLLQIEEVDRGEEDNKNVNNNDDAGNNASYEEDYVESNIDHITNDQDITPERLKTIISKINEKDIYLKLHFFSEILKLATKPIRHLCVFNYEILDMVEIVALKFKEFKSNIYLFYLTKYYLINPEIIKSSCNKDLIDALGIFLENYFYFVNEIIISDGYFMQFIKEERLLFDLVFIENLVVRNVFADIYLKESIYTIYFNLTFNLTFTNSDVDTYNTLNLIYATYSAPNKASRYSNDSSLSLIHLTDFQTARHNNKKEEIKYENLKYANYLKQELNSNKYNLLRKVMCDFEEEYFPQFTENGGSSRVHIVFRYFNNLIVKPLFILVNHYLLFEKDLKAEDSSKMYDLVLTFLKITNNLYISTSISMSQGEDSCNNDKKLGSGSDSVHGTSTFSLIIRKNLSDYEIKQIKHDILELEKVIKYFEIEKIIGIYRKNLQLILLTSVSHECDVNNENYKSIDDEEKLKINESSSYLRNYSQKITDVSNIYSYTFKNSYQLNLSFIDVCYSASNLQNDLQIRVVNYVECKYFDKLSYLNFENIIVETPPDLCNSVDENFSSFYRNFYLFEIINNYFYNDSKGLQTIYNNKLNQDPNKVFKSLFLFIIKNGIYINLLNECRSMYEINKSVNYKPSFTYEVAIISIEFLFKLIENRNEIFQSFLFDLKILDTEEEPFENLKISDPTKKINNELRKYFSHSEKNFNQPQAKISLKRGSTVNYALLKLASKRLNDLISHKDLDDKQQNEKYKFINFLFLVMKLILKNIPLNEKSLQYRNREFKSYHSLLYIYNGLFSIVIQMIQGMKKSFMDVIYKNIPRMNLDEQFPDHSEVYFFLKFAENNRDLIYNENILDFTILPIKALCIVILNNIISQNIVDPTSIVKLCSTLFSMDKLLIVISQHLKALYIKYQMNIDYNDDKFTELFQEHEMSEQNLKELKILFENNLEFSKDDFYKLSSQIYLFITILGNRYNLASAKKVLENAQKELVRPWLKGKSENIPNSLGVSNNYNSIKNRNKVFSSLSNNKILIDNEEKVLDNELEYKLNRHLSVDFRSSMDHAINFVHNTKDSSSKISTNNLIVACKFFSEIICSCEFVFDDNDPTTDDLKTVFFITNPLTSLVSTKSIEKFYQEVDRSGKTTKQSGLIYRLKEFETEIKYKLNYLKDKETLKWIFEMINNNYIDLINFSISLLINFLMLISLKGENFESNNTISFLLIYILASCQVICNVIYMVFFYKTKYHYYIILKTSFLHNNSNLKLRNLIDRFKLFVLDSFLWTDETCIPVINLITTGIAFLSINFSFLFTIQLFSIMKFVRTMQEIFIAFKLRLWQICSMIAFLAIIINFYAIFGFTFVANQFNLTLGDGHVENVCQSLISCYMTYFNYGIRAGGGVGDLLNTNFDTTSNEYWIIYISNFVFYVTVILIILNMINGIIISTFSSIRDENEQRLEDIEGKCFICSIPKVEFEKLKVDFKHHINSEHNYKTYIKYLLGCRLADFNEINPDQIFLKSCIDKSQIKFFPIYRAGALNFKEVESDEE